MNQFRFLKWEVYADSKELASLILKLVAQMPKEYRFELGSQIIRSGFSIPLNIAEGSGKESDKELNRFIDIALGSAYETFAAIDILQSNGLITKSEFNELADKLQKISSQLGGFKKKIKSLS